jgi:hypothetical protein
MVSNFETIWKMPTKTDAGRTIESTLHSHYWLTTDWTGSTYSRPIGPMLPVGTSGLVPICPIGDKEGGPRTEVPYFPSFRNLKICQLVSSAISSWS